MNSEKLPETSVFIVLPLTAIDFILLHLLQSPTKNFVPSKAILPSETFLLLKCRTLMRQKSF